MLILGQNGDVMVNVECLHAITTYKFFEHKDGKEIGEKFRILAWHGEYEESFWGIGDYATEDRAKEIIREIWMKYGEYLHRQSEPAILRGSTDVPEAFWVLPKVFEMPKE